MGSAKVKLGISLDASILYLLLLPEQNVTSLQSVMVEI
jgi:hypothetical protein